MPRIRNKKRSGCFLMPEKEAASTLRNKGATRRASSVLTDCSQRAREPFSKKLCTHNDWYQYLRAVHPHQLIRTDGSEPYHKHEENELQFLAQLHMLNSDNLLALDLMLDALRAVASNEILRVHFVKSLYILLPRLVPQSRRDSVQIVLRVLARHRTCFDVQVQGCSYLSALITTPEDIAHPKRCIDVLAESLESYAKDSEAFTLIVLDLLQRVKICNPNYDDWVEATPVLLRAVANHPTSSLTQRAGLSLVAWLSENEGCRKRIIQNQGLELIPMIIQFHPHDSLVCVNAAAALCWIIHAGESVSSRPAFPRHHVPVILSTLANHIDNESVFGNCVCVLCGLGEMDNEAELLRAIRHGMKAHIRSAKVVESCLRWIRFRNVNECSDELKLSMGICLDGMMYHKEESHLQAQGCEVVAHMAGFPDLREELLRTGAVDVVLEVTKRHCKETRVQRSTLLFLAQLLPSNGETTSFGGNVSTLQTICCSLWQQ